MTYFQDITDNIFGILGNSKNSAISGIAKQFSIFSCANKGWEAM